MIRPALALLVLILAWSLEARAGDDRTVPIAEVVRVVDGDTIDVLVDLWPKPQIQIRARVRLAGINTPETRTRRECEKAAGEAAKAYAQAWLDDRAGWLDLELHGVGKFGRALGTIIDTRSETSLNAALLAAGHAIEYDGGRRGAWRCK